MRRARIGAGVVAVLVLLTPLLLAGPARAADDTFVGTYEGWGEGTGNGGGKATSAVTVWVQDLGGTVRFTIRAARLGITVDATGTKQWQGDDTLVVPVTIRELGVRARGTFTLERDGEAWILSARGRGKVLTYQGKGTILAVRVATGVAVPGIADNIKGGIDALFGGPPEAEEAPPEAIKGGTLKPPKPPAQVEQVKPASTLAAAEAAPPMPEYDRWVLVLAATLLLLFLFGLFIFV